MPDAMAVNNMIDGRYIQMFGSNKVNPMLKCHSCSNPEIKTVAAKMTPRISAKNVTTIFSAKN